MLQARSPLHKSKHKVTSDNPYHVEEVNPDVELLDHLEYLYFRALEKVTSQFPSSITDRQSPFGIEEAYRGSKREHDVVGKKGKYEKVVQEARRSSRREERDEGAMVGWYRMVAWVKLQAETRTARSTNEDSHEMIPGPPNIIASIILLEGRRFADNQSDVSRRLRESRETG
ncbi:hypothetical protein KM043_012785 [Ampulex compressa]|nr:hypothetical protein KM043_012785 [Ampulex compressa]